jgi:y4mF family transcriptional regulator
MAPTMTITRLSQTIRFLRKQSGLTQLQLAQLAGVSKTVVFDVEKGKETVQLDSILKILAILNVKITLETPIKQTGEENEKS